MDEKTLRALVEAGAIKQVRIVADGSCVHAEADTLNGTVTACTLKGSIRTWTTLDAAARWVRKLGIGIIKVDLTKWQPHQRPSSLQ